MLKKSLLQIQKLIYFFDNTVISKKYEYKIEIVRRQYSGHEYQVIHGIRIVDCIFLNPQNKQLWIMDYRS